MKLRQKLAAVLAATMVVTAVPVTTMAASTNRVTQTQTVAKDSAFETGLVMDLQDKLTSGSVFFLELEGGEFTSVTPTGAVTVDVKPGSKTAVVTATADIEPGTIKFDIVGKATATETVLNVLAENTTVTEGKFVVARTNEAKATVSVADATSFYTDGTVANITIEEAYPGAFAAAKAADQKIELVLENGDFEFVSGTATLGKGFAVDTVAVTPDAKDGQIATIDLSGLDLKSNARGSVVISNLKVKSTTKTPETGDLNITVGGALVEDKEYKVATIADYGVSLKMKDDKAVEIVAGRDKEIEFTLEENVDDSINNGRYVEFKLTEGYFTTGSTLKVGKEEIKVDTKTTTNANKTLALIVEKIDDVERVVGVEAKLTTTSDRDKFVVKATVSAPIALTGDIKVTAEGRAIGEELEVLAATVKAPVAIETEAAVLKVGLKEQKAGKIVITETEKAMLKKGKTLVFDLAVEEGMEFTGKPEVKVTAGDLLLGDIELKDGKLVVEVKRASREASTIEVSDFGIKLDRTVPQGKYDLTIGGEALAENKTTLEVADFFIVGTPNTEDITNGMRKGTASFVNGATTYTVNGETKEMDAAAYISTAGRMMLPVRYVSEAFGIDGNNVIFADGTVTILAGTRTLQVKNGSDIAILNGAQIKMAEKVVIKDGRTYVPVGEVGRLLGVSVSYDNATKTATFENK